MTSTISGQREASEVLKQDGRGRVRTPAGRREALLDEFEHSGLSGAKFAELAGVKYATFASWVQKRRHARPPAVAESGAGAITAVAEGKAPMQLFEAYTEVASGDGVGLQVEFPGGARVKVQTPLQLQLAAELLRLLNGGGMRTC